MESLIVGITGHTNIEKAAGLNQPVLNGGLDYQVESFNKIENDIVLALQNVCAFYGVDFNNLTLVSGMARGVDEIFALIAIKYNLKLILSIPGSVQWHMNRNATRGDMRAQAVYYQKILDYANIVEIVEVPKNYNGIVYKFVNFARNQNIIDESNIVLSYSSYSSSGTDNAISLAKKCGKYFGNIPEILTQKKDL